MSTVFRITKVNDDSEKKTSKNSSWREANVMISSFISRIQVGHPNRNNSELFAKILLPTYFFQPSHFNSRIEPTPLDRDPLKREIRPIGLVWKQFPVMESSTDNRGVNHRRIHLKGTENFCMNSKITEMDHFLSRFARVSF